VFRGVQAHIGCAGGAQKECIGCAGWSKRLQRVCKWCVGGVSGLFGEVFRGE
jgi:hypothetical protein